jgi:hypothetical protein
VQQAVADAHAGHPSRDQLLRERDALRAENRQLWQALEDTIDFPPAKQQHFVVQEGVEAVHHVRGLMMAAACTAVQPRAWFRSRKPAQAEQYLRQVRLGQTEQGSYVLTVQSRVPPH